MIAEYREFPLKSREFYREKWGRKFINAPLYVLAIVYNDRLAFFVEEAARYEEIRIAWDHKHKREKVLPYEYESASQLLEDFWAAVDKIIK